MRKNTLQPFNTTNKVFTCICDITTSVLGLGYYPEDYQFHLALGDAYYHSSSYTESSQFYCSALEKWQLSPSQDTTEDFIKVKIGTTKQTTLQ